MIVLDNEAVQVLVADAHPKRRAMLALVERALTRRQSDRHRRLSGGDVVSVPTVVRVEAGWDRTAPTLANHLAIRDIGLAGYENAAAELVATRRSERSGRALSAADAHLGAIIDDGDVVVSSDTADVEWMASQRNISVRVVRI